MGKILAYIITGCEEQHHGPFELFLLVLYFSPPPLISLLLSRKFRFRCLKCSRMHVTAKNRFSARTCEDRSQAY